MLNVHFMCFTMTYASQNCPSVTVLVMKSVKKETFTAIELDSRLSSESQVQVKSSPKRKRKREGLGLS